MEIFRFNVSRLAVSVQMHILFPLYEGMDGYEEHETYPGGKSDLRWY